MHSTPSEAFEALATFDAMWRKFNIADNPRFLTVSGAGGEALYHVADHGTTPDGLRYINLIRQSDDAIRSITSDINNRENVSRLLISFGGFAHKFHN